MLPTEFWEACPVRGEVRTGTLLDSSELLALLRHATLAFEARGDHGAKFRFYHGPSQEFFVTRDVLPSATDPTFPAFVDRVAQLHEPSEFGIVLNGCHAFHPALWHRLRKFLKCLYEVIGRPIGRVDPALFMGNYRATPFGVHADAAGVFMFVVYGTRQVHLWEPDDWLPIAQDRLRFHRHLQLAINCEAKAGEVIYWPSRYYHVITSREVSAALSIAVYLEDLTVLTNSVDRLIESVAHDHGPIVAAPKAHRDIDELSERVAALVVEGVGDADALEERVTSAVLARYTSLGLLWPNDGFCPFVDPRGEVDETSVLRVTKDLTLEYRPTRGGNLVVATNGWAMIVPYHPAFVGLCSRLMSSHLIKVADVLAELDLGECRTVSGSVVRCDPTALVAILEQLRRAGYVSCMRTDVLGEQYETRDELDIVWHGV